MIRGAIQDALRVASCLALLLPAIGPVAHAEGRILPVAIAADAVDTDPNISTRDFKGHKAWSILWLRDEQGRELHIGFIEGLRLPYREHPEEMLSFAHDESSPDPAEQTLDLQGRAETIWERDVFWLVMSERAVMTPDPKKPETTAGGQLHRGDARRHCAVFTTDPAPRDGTLVGAYCRDLAPGATVDAATARQWLDSLDLTVTTPEGGMIRSD